MISNSQLPASIGIGWCGHPDAPVIGRLDQHPHRPEIAGRQPDGHGGIFDAKRDAESSPGRMHKQ